MVPSTRRASDLAVGFGCCAEGDDLVAGGQLDFLHGDRDTENVGPERQRGVSVIIVCQPTICSASS